jgi:hypothetical protein
MNAAVWYCFLLAEYTSSVKKSEIIYLCFTMSAIEKLSDTFVSEETYFELEVLSEVRHEYLIGKLVSKEGSTYWHSLIIANVLSH